MLAERAIKAAIERRFKLLISIPKPNINTPRYIGWRNQLYIPTVISGAPGFGIGETLKEGRSAMYAKAKTVTAPR
jgi:hypothetical protein